MTTSAPEAMAWVTPGTLLSSLVSSSTDPSATYSARCPQRKPSAIHAHAASARSRSVEYAQAAWSNGPTPSGVCRCPDDLVISARRAAVRRDDLRPDELSVTGQAVTPSTRASCDEVQAPSAWCQQSRHRWDGWVGRTVADRHLHAVRQARQRHREVAACVPKRIGRQFVHHETAVLDQTPTVPAGEHLGHEASGSRRTRVCGWEPPRHLSRLRCGRVGEDL